MSSIAFRTIEGRVAFVTEINSRQSLNLFLALMRMYNKYNVSCLSNPLSLQLVFDILKYNVVQHAFS
ncbi:MAG: hypothetical protein RB294_09435 [Bacteroidales bacterium]|nr:hypothetical protein [Bacteroidales bacterium]